MLVTWRAFIVGGLVLVGGFASPAAAQIAADIGPLVGYYRPFGHFDPASVYSTALPATPSQLSGVAWGGAAHLSWGGRVGIEGELTAARSSVPMVNTPDGPRGPTGAQVTVLTVQGEYDVSPAPKWFRLWLSAGPGIVRHGGDSYATVGSPVSVGGGVGIELAAPIAPHVELTAGASSLWYEFDLKMPADLRENPGDLERGAQTDALIHVGLRLRWGGF